MSEEERKVYYHEIKIKSIAKFFQAILVYMLDFKNAFDNPKKNTKNRVHDASFRIRAKNVHDEIQSKNSMHSRFEALRASLSERLHSVGSPSNF